MGRSSAVPCAPPVGRSPLALPRVQAYVVVVVVPGGKKGCSWQTEVRTVGGHLEAKHLAVEACGPIEVGNAQVHVPDAHRRGKL